MVRYLTREGAGDGSSYWVLSIQVEMEEGASSDQGNVIYGNAPLRRDVTHHGNHRNIKCIFDYVHRLCW